MGLRSRSAIIWKPPQMWRQLAWAGLSTSAESPTEEHKLSSLNLEMKTLSVGKHMPPDFLLFFLFRQVLRPKRFWVGFKILWREGKAVLLFYMFENQGFLCMWEEYKSYCLGSLFSLRSSSPVDKHVSHSMKLILCSLWQLKVALFAHLVYFVLTCADFEKKKTNWIAGEIYSLSKKSCASVHNLRWKLLCLPA